MSAAATEDDGSEPGHPPGLPRRWLVARVSPPPRGLELALAETLSRLGGRGMERRPGSIVVHFPEPSDPEQFRRRIEGVVERTPGLRDVRFSWSSRPAELQRRRWAEEWEERPHGGLRRITPRLVIVPSSTAFEPADGEVAVRVAPGPAFGTASHPTTRACLRLLDGLLTKGDRVLDVGTGSGILAIAAVLLGASDVLALERDRLALSAAEENVRANQVEGLVSLRSVQVDRATPVFRPPFDGITANLASGPILDLLGWLVANLGASGWLILSGVPRQDRKDVEAEARKLDLRLAAHDLEDGWWTGGFRIG